MVQLMRSIDRQASPPSGPTAATSIHGMCCWEALLTRPAARSLLPPAAGPFIQSFDAEAMPRSPVERFRMLFRCAEQHHPHQRPALLSLQLPWKAWRMLQSVSRHRKPPNGSKGDCWGDCFWLRLTDRCHRRSPFPSLPPPSARPSWLYEELEPYLKIGLEVRPGRRRSRVSDEGL